jgi:hypothetical protein
MAWPGSISPFNTRLHNSSAAQEVVVRNVFFFFTFTPAGAFNPWMDAQGQQLLQQWPVQKKPPSTSYSKLQGLAQSRCYYWCLRKYRITQ